MADLDDGNPPRKRFHARRKTTRSALETKLANWGTAPGQEMIPLPGEEDGDGDAVTEG